MTLTPEEKARINPGLSAVLSFFFNGLGQIYNGQIKKGLTILCLSVAIMIPILMGALLVAHYFLAKSILSWELRIGLVLFLGGIACITILGIYAIGDAYSTAKKRISE